MNTTELKALADQCICHPASRGISEVEKAGEGLKELIAAHEDAQGEIRALRATEQNLRERVKALEDGLRALYKGYVNLLDGGKMRIESLGGTCDPVDRMEAESPYLRAARALLEQKP